MSTTPDRRHRGAGTNPPRRRARTAPSGPGTRWLALVVLVGILSTLGLVRPATAGAAVPTTITLSSSTTSSVFGQRVTFVATVRAGTTNPPGSVTFFDGSTPLGTASLFFGRYALAVGSLSVGSHQIVATYAGGSSYDGSTATLSQVVAVAPTSLTVSSSVAAPVAGQAVTLAAAPRAVAPGAGAPTGTVTFADGPKTLGVGWHWAGTFTLKTSSLSVGTHEITATYGGSDAFAGSTASLTLVIAPAPTTITVVPSANPSIRGEAVTVTASVAVAAPGAGAPTGTVTFSEGTTKLAAANHWFGKYTATLPALPLGVHEIAATYGGYPSFAGSTTTFTLDVVLPRPGLVVTSSSPSAVVGQPVTFTADAVGTTSTGSSTVPTGTVTLVDGDATLGTAELLDGTASVTVGSLSLGAHDLTLRYAGDADHQAAAVTTTQTVVPASTTVSVRAATETLPTGESILLTASLTVDAPGSGIPTGTVTFTAGDAVLGRGVLEGGAVTVALPPLATGEHTVAVAYDGDASFLASASVHTQRVGAPSSVAIAPDDRPTPIGAPIPFAMTVEARGDVDDPSRPAGPPTGAIELTENGTVLGRVDLVDGTAVLEVANLDAGDHHVVATYSGDGSYASSSTSTVRTVHRAASTIVAVTSVDPAVVGQDVHLTVTVAVGAPGRAVATGSVVVRDGDVVLGAADVDPDGVAQLTLPDAAVGAHTITAAYVGDARVAPSSTEIERHVVPAGSALSLSSSAAPAVAGQPVDLHVVVAAAAPGSGTPTGTVTFTEGATVIGVGTLAAGTATMALTGLPIGDHVVTASYDGDGSFTAGSVELVVAVVRATATIDVVSSADPSVFGDPAVLTVAVTAVGPGIGGPTGAVVVAAGDVVVAAASIDGPGPQLLALPEMPVGRYELTVRYSGDGSFEPAQTTVVQRVEGVASTISMAVSADQSVVGAPPSVSLLVESPAGRGTPMGVVDLRQGEVFLTSVALDGGAAAVALPPLAVGDVEITATYGGDDVHAPSTAAALHTVHRAPSTSSIASRAQPAVFGQAVTLDVRVRTDSPGTGVPTGAVVITDGAEVLGTVELDESGATSIVLPHLPAGDATLAASYTGDAAFLPSRATVEQRVDPAASFVTLAADHAGDGDGPVASVVAAREWTARLVVTAGEPSTAVPAGSLTVVADGEALGTATLAADGTAEVQLTALAVGRHTITVTFAPEPVGAFSPSTLTFDQVVEPTPTTVLLAAGPTPVAAGHDLTLDATVMVDPTGLPVVEGSVRFTEGTATLGTVAVADGRASLTTSTLGAGPHLVTATYLGTDATAPSTASVAVVVQAATSVAVASSANPVAFGAEATLTALVRAVAGDAMPTGLVTFREGATDLAAGLLVDGSVSVRSGALRPGTHLITVTYDGDGASLPSAGSFTLTVDPVPTTLAIGSDAPAATFGQQGTLWATVSTPAGPAAAGTVTFSVGTTVLGVAPHFYGRYSIRLGVLPVGVHTIEARYSGAGNDGPSGGSFLQRVDAASTTIGVVSTANPTVATAPAMLQARVTIGAPGGGPLVGTVSFREGPVVLATVSAPFFGRYGFSLAGLSAGTHHLTVTFDGGPGHTPSSASITQVIEPAATRVTLASSASPSGVFSDATIHATVSPVPPAVGLPAGTLTFSEGGRALASPPLFFNRYGMALTDLPVGTHEIVATFTGTGNHTGSSAVHVQEIVRSAPKLTVRSSRNPADRRDGSHLSVMVTSLAGAMHDMPGAAGQGTVTFTDNGAPIAVVPVDGGRAHLSYLDLAPGAHELVARYSGNDAFLPLDSLPVVQTIREVVEPSTDEAAPCAAAVAVGDSRLMGVGLLGRAARTAIGAGSPLANPPILADAPRLQAIMGYRYGTFAHLEWVKAEKARCAEPRRYVTVLGPNHTLFPTFLAGDTRAWDAVDTAEMHALLDLMTTDDAYGPGGSVVVSTFPYASHAPTWGREAAAAHDQAIQGYLAAHPERDVQVLVLDADQISWVTAVDDWYHPTGSVSVTAPPMGQDELAFQVYSGVARLRPELAAPATTTILDVPSSAPFRSDVTLAASVAATPTGSTGSTTTTLRGAVSFLDGPEVLATVPLDATGRAAWSTDQFGVGDHQLVARFESAGGSFPSEAAAPLAVDPAGTELVLAAPPTAASSAGFVLAATVTAIAPSHGTPHGTVTFREGDRFVGTGTYFFGTTNLWIASLPVGEHDLTADFADADYRASSATVTVTITRDPTTVSLTGSAPELAAASGDYVEARVGGPVGSGAAGAVHFTEEGRILAEAPMWAGRAYLPLTALAPGDHLITAVYSGDEQREPSSASLAISLTTAPPPADRCAALVAIGDERLHTMASFGRLGSIATGGQGSPFVNDPLLLTAPLVVGAAGSRDGDPAVLATITEQRAACPDRAAAFMALLAPEAAVEEPPTGSHDALVQMLDHATGTDGPGQPGRVLVVSSPLPAGADPGMQDRVATRDLAVREYIARHPERDVHLLEITPAELEPSDAESARSPVAVRPFDAATDMDELSYLVVAGAARTFLDLAAPHQDWSGPEGAERLAVYGDSGTALSLDVLTPILQQAYQTHMAARPGSRYDQMLAFVEKVQASAGADGAGDIVVVQGGTNDAIHAAGGNWDLGRSPAVGATFMDRNPQARCFVYVTAVAYSAAPAVNTASTDLNVWIRGLPATDGRVQVADWDALVRDYEAQGEPDGPIILADRLHPNALGQRLLAGAILDAAARCPAT